jgi:hypothetical protein
MWKEERTDRCLKLIDAFLDYADVCKHGPKENKMPKLLTDHQFLVMNGTYENFLMKSEIILY